MQKQTSDKRVNLRHLVLPAAVLLTLVGSAVRTNASVWTSDWQGSSGQYPSELAYPYSLLDTGPQDPVLNATGVLTLDSTPTNADVLGYEMSTLGWPDPLVVETRVKFVSSAEITPFRTAIAIGFSRSDNMMNVLFVDDDHIFLLLNNGDVGDETLVPTADDFHTYRIEVTAAGNIAVYYDNALALEDDLFFYAWAGDSEKIYFGDTSEEVNGVSEWQFLRHNSTIPEPATLSLLALGSLIALRRRRG